jgi:hypothetical protein
VPTISNIRRYPSLKAVTLHLVEINKKYNLVAKTLGSVRYRPVQAAGVINVSPSERLPTTVAPLSGRAIEALSKNSKALKQLTDQYTALSNMVLNLNTNFNTKDIDPKLVSALRIAIKNLQDKIRVSIDSANEQSFQSADKYMAKTTRVYSEKVRRFLDKKFKADGIIFYSSGMYEGQPAITAFITYENIKNAAGEIDPHIVIAITQINAPLTVKEAQTITDESGKQSEQQIEKTVAMKTDHYVNANLISIRPIGQFKLGMKLDSNPTKALNEIVKLVQNQMVADSHLSALNPKMVPVTPDQVKINKNVSVSSVKFDETSITVGLQPNIKTQQTAEQVAQDIFKKINSAMKAGRPNTRDRIVYKLAKKTKGWSIVYRFTTGDKYSGRTMTQEENEKLSQVFKGRELDAMKRTLNEME